MTPLLLRSRIVVDLSAPARPDAILQHRGQARIQAIRDGAEQILGLDITIAEAHRMVLACLLGTYAS